MDQAKRLFWQTCKKPIPAASSSSSSSSSLSSSSSSPKAEARAAAAAGAASGSSEEAFTYDVGVGHAIQGLDDGLLVMREGEVARLLMTGSFGYGVEGFPPWAVPANSDLMLDVWLLKVGQAVTLPDKYELMRRKTEQKYFKGRKLSSVNYLLTGGRFFNKQQEELRRKQGAAHLGSWSVCL